LTERQPYKVDRTSTLRYNYICKCWSRRNKHFGRGFDSLHLHQFITGGLCNPFRGCTWFRRVCKGLGSLRWWHWPNQAVF